jgi:hypothetical protein
MSFVDSPMCKSGEFCGPCRERREFREAVAEGGEVDFACRPRGLPIVPTTPRPRRSQTFLPLRTPPAPNTIKPRPIYLPIPRDQWPPKIRKIARHQQPGDKGVGDVLERRYARFGGRFYKRALKLIGMSCNCEAEQQRLNMLYPFT